MIEELHEEDYDWHEEQSQWMLEDLSSTASSFVQVNDTEGAGIATATDPTYVGEIAPKRNYMQHYPWWEINKKTEDEDYLVRTRMKKRSGEALLVDPGSPNNLVGDQWSMKQAAACREHGGTPPSYSQLNTPLEVGGVGTGTQSAHREVKHHVSFDNGTEAFYVAPELPNSSTPALLGQRSLKRNRTVLDCYNNRMYQVGPGGYKIALSLGSRTFDLEESHSGHLMLPCSSFKKNAHGKKPTQHMQTEEVEKADTTTKTTTVHIESEAEEVPIQM